MKPIKLTIEGLNSFESKQELDFQSLTGGVFGIFGKTGSGKTTYATKNFNNDKFLITKTKKLHSDLCSFKNLFIQDKVC